MPAERPPSAPAQVAVYLITTGLLLTASILIAGEAARRGAPRLWLLSVAMPVAGLVHLAMAGMPALRAALRGPVLAYGAMSAAFLALSLSIVWLATPHTGAGYIAFVHALPPLLTWALARVMGMEPPSARRLLAVLLGLAGGLLLGAAKLIGAPPGTAGWTLIASAIPVILAIGNILRTRFWPGEAPLLTLAGLTLLLAGLMVAPVAALTEGTSALPRLAEGRIAPLLGALVLCNVVQYVTYFRLQHAGGPVVLSLIGPIAAVTGPPAAVLLLGDALPAVYPAAALLTGAGVWLMLRSRMAPQPAA